MDAVQMIDLGCETRGQKLVKSPARHFADDETTRSFRPPTPSRFGKNLKRLLPIFTLGILSKSKLSERVRGRDQNLFITLL
jgi:hypothetical protein